MSGKAKSLVVWLVIAFLLYMIVTKPDRSADFLHSVSDWIESFFQGIGSFFSSLTS